MIEALTPDEALAARIRRTLAGRHQPMPRWLVDLGQARVTRVREMIHVLRDGDDYAVEVDVAGGHVMCALIYVDNNLNGVVKDAFLIPGPLEMFEEAMAQIGEPDLDYRPADPATVRAIVELAVEHGAIMFPPPESETWPAIRPLVRWILRLLPEGGVAPEPHEWTDAEMAELAGEFLTSPQGRAYDDSDHRALLEELLWFGVSQGTCDPLRWSPVNVEIVLTDWYPRKVVGETAYLAKLPDLLRAFVRYCHARQQIPAALTTETMESIDRWEPDFQRQIRTERAQGAEALARLLVDAQPSSFGPMADLEEAVGGRSALANLSADPLPDEEFEWAGIPEDIHGTVAEILRLCDANADEFLDVEHRTANRRLLGRLAVADPEFFRGRAAARTSAAAISWMVAHANDTIGYGRPLTAKALLAPYGGGSPSQRAERFCAVLGLGARFPSDGPMSLGSADLLVSARRKQIVAQREALEST